VILAAGSGAYDRADVSASSVQFGNLSLNVSGSAMGNYVLSPRVTSLAGGAQITPATLTASLTGNVIKVYDGTTAAALTSINYLLSGVIGKDTVSLNNPASGTYDNANAGGNEDIIVTGLALDNGNYILSSTIVGKDLVSLNNPTSSTFETANLGNTADAGSKKTITVTGLKLDNPNYQLVDRSGKVISSISGAIGTITPKPITASYNGDIADLTKIYNGDSSTKMKPDSLSLDGIVSQNNVRDAVSIASTFTSAYADANAGNKKITVSGLTLTGAMAGNYLLTPTLDLDGHINQAKLTASYTGDRANLIKTYDGDSTTKIKPGSLSLNGIIGNDSVNLGAFTSAYADANAGDKKINVSGLSLQGAMAGNYLLTPTLDLDGHINQAKLTASYNGDNANLTKTYDGTTTTKVTPGLLSLKDVVGTDDVRIASTFTSAYADANAGDKKITVSGLTLTGDMAGNYLLASTLDINGAITKKALTASYTGAAITKVYDGNNTATVDPSLISLSSIVEGKKFRDDVSINSTFTSTYDNANAGTGKTVRVTGLSLDNANYQLESTTINGAIGAITPATLTATLSGVVSKVYDGDTIAKISPVNYILNGTIYGKDTANLVLNNPASGSYDTANAGSGINVTVSGLVLTGSAANNYQLASTTINAPIGTITALPPPPAGNGNSLTITGVISTPSFMRMVQAAVPPPPPPAPAGPAGGGSFGSAGPSSGGGGFSQSAGEAVAGGPASAPPPQEGSGQSGDGASDPNSPPPAPGSGPVADNGSAPAANGAPVAANGSAAGGAAAGGSTSTGAAAGGASHAGGTAGSSSGSGSPGQAPAHLPASVVATTRLNSPVSAGNSAAAAFHRLNPTISAGEGLSEGSVSSSGEAAPSQGAAQVNQSRATRFGGIGSDSTPGGDLNSMVQILAL
jgi:hypothetical protein